MLFFCGYHHHSTTGASSTPSPACDGINRFPTGHGRTNLGPRKSPWHSHGGSTAENHRTSSSLEDFRAMFATGGSANDVRLDGVYEMLCKNMLALTLLKLKT